MSGPADTARTRRLRWGLYGCSTLLIALVLLVAVVAVVAYLDYTEPESAFPARLAAAVAGAAPGGEVALLPLADGHADSLHLFAPGATSAAAIEACLGFDWEKAELLAGHLTEGMPGGFAVVTDGAVTDYGWHLVGAQPLSFADWPCAVTPDDDRFAVADEAGVRVLRQVPVVPEGAAE